MSEDGKFTVLLSQCINRWSGHFPTDLSVTWPGG